MVEGDHHLRKAPNPHHNVEAGMKILLYGVGSGGVKILNWDVANRRLPQPILTQGICLTMSYFVRPD